jgi:uncharacterized lipoprotein YmbA
MSKLAILIPLLILTSCVSPITVRRFVLTSPTANRAESRLTVKLKSIRMPTYLEGTGMVTQIGSNEINVSDANVWATPFRDAFPRCLSQNLKDQLKTESIFGANYLQPTDYTLALEVNRFVKTMDDKVILDANWILSGHGKKAIIRRTAVSIDGPFGGDYALIASGHSKAIAELSRLIAVDMKSH